MARIEPLWSSPELEVYRFDHPVEHEDQPYEEVAPAYRASFVEAGAFELAVGEGRWRVAAGDVMLSHPGMAYRAGFEGRGFNDVCLSVVLKAPPEGFDGCSAWGVAGAPVLGASNRLRYLRWGLRQGLAHGSPTLVEHCAAEIFSGPAGGDPRPLIGERTLVWYAERVHRARERLDRDFAEPLSAGELARSVGMSLFHFSRVFAELTGLPPHRYLLRARLGAARAMLAQGATVTETCYACGFNNLSHFSRSFARRHGRAPSQIAG